MTDEKKEIMENIKDLLKEANRNFLSVINYCLQTRAQVLILTKPELERLVGLIKELAE